MRTFEIVVLNKIIQKIFRQVVTNNASLAEKLEIKCHSLDQAANVQMFNLNQNEIKHLSSTHAKRSRQHGPHVPKPALKDDPQTVKPLLKH